ncbi:MAG TPA: hypothetical protein VHC70_03410 [Phycisphaerales bacterium]|nr:hypothetical protein [Phycisphaerales bacterium]
MFRRIAAVSALSLAGVASAYAATPNPAQPAESKPSAPTPKEASQLPNNKNADGTLKVVVHHNAGAAEDKTDARVDVGDVKISQPGAAGMAQAESTPRADGAVAMPANTYGPGEPMWQIREREAAQTKMMKADADLARIDADRARPYYNDYTYPRDILAENASFGRFSIGGPAWTSFGGGWFNAAGTGRFRGLRGPVTTTVIHDDQLGATGQRAFSQAAYPINDGSQDAHDAAVRRFGNDSLPRINAIQDAIDRAHTNASTEHIPPAPGR